MPVVPKFAGLSWRELLRTTWQEAAKTNIANRAAELAFWFLLGFFPMLLSVVSMVSTLTSASDSQVILMNYVGEVLPSSASNLVQQVLAQTATTGRVWFALLFTLWSSSSATSGLIDTLNEIYGVKESRPWWLCRLIAERFFNPLCLEDRTVAGLSLSAYSGASRSLPLRPEHSPAEIEMAFSWERLRGNRVDGRLTSVQGVHPSLQ
jgi:hypothetical protein